MADNKGTKETVNQHKLMAAGVKPTGYAKGGKVKGGKK